MTIFILYKLIIISFALKDLSEFIGEIVINLAEEVSHRFAKIGIYLAGYLLTCPKCFSFWLSLIISGDLFMAALVSLHIQVITYLFNNYFKTELTKTKL